jgi:hypothetical protein
LIEYRDGLRLSILMLNGYVLQRAAAVRVRGRLTSPAAGLHGIVGHTGDTTTLAAMFSQARQQPTWHFDHLVDYIERLVEGGEAPYPVERTLLTTGLVDAVMNSRHEGGRRLETPYLDVAYQPPAEPPFHVRSFVIPGRQSA